MGRVTWALIRGAWTEQWNRYWRFSLLKLGLWRFLATGGLMALLLARLEPAPVPLATALASLLIQSGFGAYLLGLFLGRDDLFGRRIVHLWQITPAGGGQLLTAVVIADLPQRLLNSLLLAAGAAVLFSAPWWLVPLFWGLAVAGSLVGYSLAVVTLISWVRLAPHSLALLWALSLGLVLGVLGLFVYLAVDGGRAPALALVLVGAAPWLGGFMGLFGLVPLGLGWLSGRSHPGADGYREAYLSLQELSDRLSRPRASRWPQVLPGAAGALQARLWRELWLNWFTWVRLAGALVLLGLLAWKQEVTVALGARYPTLLPLGVALGILLGLFAEVAAAMGSNDGPKVGLWQVAGVRASQIIKGKWLAVAPFGFLGLLLGWLTGHLAGQPNLPLSLATGLIGLGASVIAMAGGLCDLSPLAEGNELEVAEVLRAVLDQVPRQLGGVLGLIASFSFAVGATLLCHWLPGSVLLVALVATTVAHLALVPALWHLRRLGL